MSSLGNPAGRLHRVLQQAATIRDHHKRSGMSLVAWGELLHVDPSDLSGILRRLAIVAALPKQAGEALRAVPNLDHPRYLAWEQKVQAAFGQLNLKGNFDEFVKYIDIPTLSMLAICDDLIDKSIGENTVEEKRLHDLLGEVRELIQEVSGDKELDGYLRGYILRHLHLIEQAIGDYEFRGIDALQSGLESSVGAAVLNEALFEQAKESSKGNKLMRILGTYVLIVTAITGTVQIATQVRKFLPDLSETAVEKHEEAGVTEE